ncbi:hypothetical protein GGI17_006613 [Coemansia sp. S146]|nr:hypothetical protein GGI17_006613 [Coemansia sp. S146]
MTALTPYLRAKPSRPRPAAPLSNNPYTRSIQIKNASNTESEDERRKSKKRAYDQNRRFGLEANPEKLDARKAQKAASYRKCKEAKRLKLIQERDKLFAENTATAEPSVVSATVAPPTTEAATAGPSVASATVAPPTTEAATAGPSVASATVAPPTTEVATAGPSVVSATTAPPTLKVPSLGPMIAFKRAERYTDTSDKADAKRARERRNYANRQLKIRTRPKAEVDEYESGRKVYFKDQYQRRKANKSPAAKEKEKRRWAESYQHQRNQAIAAAARQRDMDLLELERDIPIPTTCGEDHARVFHFNARKSSLDSSLTAIRNRIIAGFGPKIVAISDNYMDMKPAMYGWTFMHTRLYPEKGTRKWMARLVVGYDDRAFGNRITRCDKTEHTISLLIGEPGGGTPHLQLLFGYLPTSSSGYSAYHQATTELVAEIDRAEYPLIIMGDLNARMGAAVGDTESCTRGALLHRLTDSRGFTILNNLMQAKNKPTYAKSAPDWPEKVAHGSSVIDYAIAQDSILFAIRAFQLIDTHATEESSAKTKIHSDHRPLELVLTLPTSAE